MKKISKEKLDYIKANAGPKPDKATKKTKIKKSRN